MTGKGIPEIAHALGEKNHLFYYPKTRTEGQQDRATNKSEVLSGVPGKKTLARARAGVGRGEFTQEKGENCFPRKAVSLRLGRSQ